MSSINFELSNLPFEIASIISKHLDNSSLANCCLVNKHWYACFISSVWEAPKVNGLEHLKSLHHSLDSIASIMKEEEEEEQELEKEKEKENKENIENIENHNTNENNNNNNEEKENNEKTISFTNLFNHLKTVKHLDLTSLVDECDLNEDDDTNNAFDYADSQNQTLFSELANNCSDLKSLALKVPSEKNSSKDAPTFFHTLGQFAKAALSLESLTLDFNDMTVFADHLQEAIPVECFSKIHTLNLQNAAMVDDSAFIWLWSNCPSLSSLTISQSCSLNDYVLNPLIRLHSDQLKVFNLERCSRLSINSLLNIIVSCKNLEKLRWVNNGASFNSPLLSNTPDFEISDMGSFMKALEENCIVDHLKELDYAFLKVTKCSVIFDYLIEKNRESLESIKCVTSKALMDASQNNIEFPNLKEVSYNNQSVSLKDLSKSYLSSSSDSICQSINNSTSVEGNNATMGLAA